MTMFSSKYSFFLLLLLIELVPTSTVHVKAIWQFGPRRLYYLVCTIYGVVSNALTNFASHSS